MGNRLSNGARWDNPAFRQLTPGAKLVLAFLEDRCDMAGFITLDPAAMAFYTGANVSSVQTALAGLEAGPEGPSKGLACPFLVVRGGVGWLPGYLDSQRCMPLNLANRAHLGMARRLEQMEPAFPGLAAACLDGQVAQWCAEGPSKGLARALKGPSKGLESPLSIHSIEESKNKKGGAGGKGNMQRPTVEDVRAYAEAKGLEMDPEAFWAHHESAGWVIGRARKPMNSWKAACTTWVKNQGKWADRPKGTGNGLEKQGAQGIQFRE